MKFCRNSIGVQFGILLGFRQDSIRDSVWDSDGILSLVYSVPHEVSGGFGGDGEALSLR